MLGHLTTERKKKQMGRTIVKDKQIITFYVEPTPVLPKLQSLKYFATRSISNSPWMGCKDIILVREGSSREIYIP